MASAVRRTTILAIRNIRTFTTLDIMAPQTRSGKSAPHAPSKSAKVPRVKKSKAPPKPKAAPSIPTDTNGPVFFWKPEQPEVGYLSQWYPDPFSDPAEPDVVFPTAEHYMMYHKAQLFHPESGAGILAATSPGEVRSLGRLIPNYSDPVWHANRERVVRDGSLLKFTQGPEAERLKALLLATGDRELVEASPRDRIWGIGFAPAKAPSSDRKKWGANLLGKALMSVREELAAVEAENNREAFLSLNT